MSNNIWSQLSRPAKATVGAFLLLLLVCVLRDTYQEPASDPLQWGKPTQKANSLVAGPLEAPFHARILKPVGMAPGNRRTKKDSPAFKLGSLSIEEYCCRMCAG